MARYELDIFGYKAQSKSKTVMYNYDTQSLSNYKIEQIRAFIRECIPNYGEVSGVLLTSLIGKNSSEYILDTDLDCIEERHEQTDVVIILEDYPVLDESGKSRVESFIEAYNHKLLNERKSKHSSLNYLKERPVIFLVRSLKGYQSINSSYPSSRKLASLLASSTILYDRYGDIMRLQKETNERKLIKSSAKLVNAKEAVYREYLLSERQIEIIRSFTEEAKENPIVDAISVSFRIKNGTLTCNILATCSVLDDYINAFGCLGYDINFKRRADELARLCSKYNRISSVKNGSVKADYCAQTNYDYPKEELANGIILFDRRLGLKKKLFNNLETITEYQAGLKELHAPNNRMVVPNNISKVVLREEIVNSISLDEDQIKIINAFIEDAKANPAVKGIYISPNLVLGKKLFQLGVLYNAENGSIAELCNLIKRYQDEYAGNFIVFNQVLFKPDGFGISNDVSTSIKFAESTVLYDNMGGTLKSLQENMKKGIYKLYLPSVHFMPLANADRVIVKDKQLEINEDK